MSFNPTYLNDDYSRHAVNKKSRKKLAKKKEKSAVSGIPTGERKNLTHMPWRSVNSMGLQQLINENHFPGTFAHSHIKG